MKLKWRDVATDPPTDLQECLCKTKHGIIAGVYNDREKMFEGYYAVNLTWWATEWVPIEEVS